MGLEKINAYKKKNHLTTEELAEKSGVPVGTLNKILTGATKDPKLETLKALARVLGCTLDDFDDGVVRPLLRAENQHPMVKKYHSLDASGKDAVDAILQVEYQRCQGNLPVEDAVVLPFYLLPTSAGPGEYLDTGERELLTFDRRRVPRDANFAIRVSGDSMEPDFLSGDTVFVKETKRLRPGDIGIFILNGEGYIKEFVETEERCMLRSKNQKYDPIVLSECDDIRYVGKVVGKA